MPLVGLKSRCAVLVANFGIGDILGLLTGVALVANLGGGIVLELLEDLALQVGAALIVNFGGAVVNSVEIGAEGGFARS